MKTEEEKLEEYNTKCHQYAIKETIQRVKFEIDIQRQIFNDILTYDDLIKMYPDYSNCYIFTSKEWDMIVNEALQKK